MKRVQYGAEAFETSDEIAHLLLELGAALARAGSAEVVAIPAITSDGNVERLEFVIGPATHLSAQPDRTPVPDPIDDQAAESIRTLLRRNAPYRYEPSALHAGAFGSYADDY